MNGSSVGAVRESETMNAYLEAWRTRQHDHTPTTYELFDDYLDAPPIADDTDRAIAAIYIDQWRSTQRDHVPAQSDAAFTAFLTGCDAGNVALDRAAGASAVELRMIGAQR